MPSVPDLERFRAASVVRGPHCAGATDVGLLRDGNEDAYWISPDASVLAVADGLGGEPDGEVASAVAIEAVADHALDDADEAGSRGARALGRVRAARGRLALAVEAGRGAAGMCTTLVVAVIGAGRAQVAHVGDSRAQLWRDGRLECETVDHNVAGELRRSGALSREDARQHPSRHQLRRVLGLDGGGEADFEEWSLERGDTLLLCSDGVCETVADAEVARILASAPTAADAARALVEAANEAGGIDNATVIVRRVT